MHLKRLIIPLLLGLTLLTFWRVTHAGFFIWDDDDYVRHNAHVQQGLSRESVTWALTTNEPGYPMSLTWLSFMADHQFSGLDPAAFHRTNLILHALNAVWLFLVLRMLTGATWRSALVAFVWALHPQRAESVAWIAERKDVLSAGLAMGVIAAYAHYSRAPSVGRYLLIVAAMVLGLLAKVMLVTLPFLLLVLDFWPLRRFRAGAELGSNPSAATDDSAPRTPVFARASISRLVLEKLPLLGVVLCFCILTYVGQSSRGFVASTAAMSMPDRLANSVLSYVRYAEKMLRVDALGVYYPYPIRFPVPLMVGCVALLLAVSAMALWFARRKPWLIAGWCWYLGMLVPVIGLVQLSGQGFADRYSYLPTIGILIMLAWSIPASWGERPLGRAALGAASAALVLTFAGFTWVQVGYWRDTADLLRHTLRVTAPNFVVEYNLGNVLVERQDFREAATHFRRAAEISPGMVEAHFNLGVTEQKLNDPLAATDAFRRALDINPDHPDARNNLAVALSQTGRLNEAILEYRRILARKPDDPQANNNLANTLVRRGDFAAAVTHYEKAIAAQPGFLMAHINLGKALANLGRIDAALARLEIARSLAPDDPTIAQTIAVVRQIRDAPK
ncbi:MAG: tetratricopeptide repeat protein [Planctomycetota bacterium]|nr:tetratricopeptide repeat protein [Planctomycetota bacterium]